MKNIKKVVILTFVLVLIFFNMNISFADEKAKLSTGKTGTDLSSMESQAKDFIEAGKTAAEGDGLNGVTTAITTNFAGLGQILTLVGAGVLVAVVAFMGIKYLTSSPDKQAALKQQLIGVVVAGIVIFGAYGIWKAIIGIVSNF